MSEVTWGTVIALALWFIGVSSGAYRLSALASRKKEDPGWAKVGLTSAFLALITLAAGMGLLVLDLRQEFRFWHLLLNLNPEAPMSIGVWSLSIFGILCLCHLIFWMPDPWRKILPLIGGWSIWDKRKIHGYVAKFGMYVAIVVAVYTGVLLAVTSIPLWRNFFLPPLIFFSALACGLTGGVLATMVLMRRIGDKTLFLPLRFLQSSLRPTLVIMLVLTGGFLILTLAQGMTGAKTHLISLGWMGFLWWGGAIGVGMIWPLINSFRDEKSFQARAQLTCWMTFLGGLILRWVVIYAGQI